MRSHMRAGRTGMALAVALGAAGAGAAWAQPGPDVLGGGPAGESGATSSGSAVAGRAPRPGMPRLDIHVQTGENDWELEPLTAELYARLGGTWKQKVDLLLGDPAIQTVAGWAVEASERRSPVEVVLSRGTGVAFFRRPKIYLTASYVRPEADPEAVERYLRNTIVHEMGHCLHFRLYGYWLPEVNYASTEFVASDGDGHQIDKVTVASSAWTEGFAEALAAYLGEDRRIQEFRFRRTVYWGVRDPRPRHTLERIEGWAAFLLHDFWAGPGAEERVARTLRVLGIEDARSRDHERHESVLEYVREHVARFPEDAPRWELVLRANTFQEDSVVTWVREAPEVQARVEALGAGLRDAGDRLQHIRVAGATWGYLGANGVVGDPSAVLADVRRRAARGASRPVFEVPGASEEELEGASLEDLRRRLRLAEQEYRGLMQSIGYSFHPKVEEAAERRDRLRAELEARGG